MFIIERMIMNFHPERVENYHCDFHVIKNYKSKNKDLVDNDKHMEFSKKLINSLFPCYSKK